MAATLIAIIQNRTQLFATELEEESHRYFSSLMYSLAAMFCLGMAIVLGTLLILVLYWDSNRIGILLTLISFFCIATVAIAWHIRNQYRSRTALLSHSITELSHDRELLEAMR